MLRNYLKPRRLLHFNPNRAAPLYFQSIRTMATDSLVVNGVKYLGQEDAQNIDKELMTDPGFSIDQLMELAGLSVASAAYNALPLDSYPRILVVCGPGNNGGDGLVAARHLVQFGYEVAIHYPKRSKSKERLFNNLVQQCEDLDIKFLRSLPEPSKLVNEYDAVIDSIFGFSFSGDVRAPFDTVLDTLVQACGGQVEGESGDDSKEGEKKGSTVAVVGGVVVAIPPKTLKRRIPLLAVDIPSGWDVEQGPVGKYRLLPSVLVSLTAPKKAATLLPDYCRHFLGGRFIPPFIIKKFNLKLPTYPGCQQVVEITPEKEQQSAQEDSKTDDKE